MAEVRGASDLSAPPSAARREPRPPVLDLSVILPARNEEGAVAGVIAEVREALREWPGTWEVVVIDDASTDATARAAESAGARVIRRPERGGYGAAVKAGLQATSGRIVALLDADGSYVPACLLELLSFLPEYDQVNGARTSEQGRARLARAPAKWLVRKLAEWIAGKRIPDLNTGMKVFKRDVIERYLWALPDGFSCSTSMTLAFLTNGHSVKYVQVEYRPRKGKSKFRPLRDGGNYAMTVIRIMTYFRPLRVFLPLASFLGFAAIALGSWHLATSPTGLADAEVLLAVSAVLVLAIGLLADLIVARGRCP